jgi:hypothetical protein
MYANFYKLTTPPFQLTPDVRFFFESSVHRQAMAYLVYGLHHAEGFIVITGEVGAGKTILVDNLLSTIDQSNFVTTTIVTTQLAGDDFCTWSPAANPECPISARRIAKAACDERFPISTSIATPPGDRDYCTTN